MDERQPQHIFGAREPAAAHELVRRLEPQATIQRADHPVRMRFCDTFDWRLHARGWTLIQSVAALELRDLSNGALLGEQNLTGGPVPPLPRDWPRGSLRDLLLPVTDVRALLELVTVEGTARVLFYTDPASQRQWRITIGDLRQVRRGASRPFLQTVELSPVDGRTKGGKRLGRLVRSCGYRTLGPTLFAPAMGRAGLRPGSYSKAFAIALRPKERAGPAFARLAGELIGRIKANRRGLEQDIDTEFLHDFRVAVRRLRVLLAVGKGVFPADVRAEARERFAALGRATNRLRDLDVYLQHREPVLSLVPADARDGADLIFSRAADARKACRRDLDARLADPGFLTVLDWGARRLATVPDPPPAGARRRIGKVADRLVIASFIRVRDRGAHLDGGAADADLHRLRIACKRHRYVIEFFASLYSPDQVKAHLARLRALQKVLGEHNDAVQELVELAGFVSDGDPAAGAAALVAEELRRRRDRQRSLIPKAYRKVAGPGCHRALRRMVDRRRKR